MAGCLPAGCAAPHPAEPARRPVVAGSTTYQADGIEHPDVVIEIEAEAFITDP